VVLVDAAAAPHVAIPEAAREIAHAEETDVRFRGGGETVPSARFPGPLRPAGLADARASSIQPSLDAGQCVRGEPPRHLGRGVGGDQPVELNQLAERRCPVPLVESPTLAMIVLD